jgi:hypothetical protein
LSARRASSRTSRVLPIPASPVSRTTRPWPVRAADQASTTAASSAARPNIGMDRPTVSAPAGAPRSRASSARVAGVGPTPSSVRKRTAKSRPATSAPARSPAAASRSRRAR